MISIGESIRELRGLFGLSQRQAADEVKISHVHLRNLEIGEAAPTTSVLNKFFEAWRIDLYMYAATRDQEHERIPQSLKPAVRRLESIWKKEIDAAIKRRLTERQA